MCACMCVCVCVEKAEFLLHLTRHVECSLFQLPIKVTTKA